MPKRRDVVAEQLRTLADDLEELWKALTRDPKKEARRERAWTIISGAAGVAATMAVRRTLVKLWPILTGESPPMPRPGQAETTAASAEPQRQADATAASAEPQPQQDESSVPEAEAPTASIPSGSSVAGP